MSDQNKSYFKDHVVFISGGTSGIGLATAVQFAQQGAARVIVCGRRKSKWQEAQEYIKTKLTAEKADIIQFWPCDIRIELQVKEIIAAIFAQFGRLDICFNNAGVQPGIVTGSDSGFITDMMFESLIAEDGSILYRIPPPQPASGPEIQTEENHPSQRTPASPFCESEIATSCIGVFYCLKWQIHYIFEKQAKDIPAAIINTSSRNGVLPDSHRPLYASSKAFILALTRSISNQVAQRALKENRAMIRVNAISPGPVDTPMEFAAFGATLGNTQQYQEYVKAATVGVPMKRTAQPEEIASSVLFLANNELASYITGTNLCIDGGHTGSPLLCACD